MASHTHNWFVLTLTADPWSGGTDVSKVACTGCSATSTSANDMRDAIHNPFGWPVKV